MNIFIDQFEFINLIRKEKKAFILKFKNIYRFFFIKLNLASIFTAYLYIVHKSVSYSFRMGFDGRTCVLRALCEASQRLMPKGNTLIEEMMRISFT